MFVTGNIIGGLGNQLFIIFAALSIAKRDNIDVYFRYSKISPSGTPRSTYFDTLLAKLPIVNNYPEQIKKIYTEVNHNLFSVIPKISENTTLSGYFQSRKYIDSIKSDILNLIELVQPSDNEIANNEINEIRIKSNERKCIFLHVRRGDYVKAAHYHYNLPMSYYQEAINYHKSLYDCFFVIFSDDLDYCQQQTVFQEMSLDEIYYCKLENDYVELILMSHLDGAIIANSSFSWWGAYLGELRREQRMSGCLESELPSLPIIVAPKIWFTGQTCQNDRILPAENWIYF